MNEHKALRVTTDPDRLWLARTRCSCGWYASWDTREERPEHAWHAYHVAVEGRIECARHVAWYRDTGHCGACGQPGDFCLCPTPCGCAGLHEVGAGFAADAVARFAAGSVDQGGLFDV